LIEALTAAFILAFLIAGFIYIIVSEMNK